MADEDEVLRRANAILKQRELARARADALVERRSNDEKGLIADISAAVAEQTASVLYIFGGNSFGAYARKGDFVQEVQIVEIVQNDTFLEEEDLSELGDDYETEDEILYSVLVCEDDDWNQDFEGESRTAALAFATEKLLSGLAQLVADGYEIVDYEAAQPSGASSPSPQPAKLQGEPDAASWVGALALLVLFGVIAASFIIGMLDR